MIKKEDLQERGIYQLKARNILYGVWISKIEGFIGVRSKFGYEFLTTEYLAREYGAATPIKLIKSLPDSIRISEESKDLKAFLKELEIEQNQEE